MSVYTCYDMVADCKSGKAEGYAFLVRQIVPALRLLVKHYGGDEASLRALIVSLRAMEDLEPVGEREFVARVRPRVLECCRFRPGEAQSLDPAVFEEALEELTFLERQLVWCETMGCDSAESARRLRVSPETAVRAREKALELLRGKMDAWNRSVITDNAGTLVGHARRTPPAEPIPFRRYLDFIDGRLTWQNREEVERLVSASWYEVDQLCVVREADDAVQGARPLEADEAAGYLDLLGVKPPRRSFWKRLVRG